MISITKYKDGVHIYGHASENCCVTVSYEIWSLYADLWYLRKDNEYYDSISCGNDEIEGISWLIADDDYQERITMRIENLMEAVNYLYPNQVELKYSDKKVKSNKNLGKYKPIKNDKKELEQ